MGDKGKSHPQVAIPHALYRPTIEKYIAKNYSVIDLRSDQELEPVITQIFSSTKEAKPSKGLRDIAEAALFSNATFRLVIRFPQIMGLDGPANVPDGVLATSRRIRHLELFFQTRTNSIQLASGPCFQGVSSGAKALGAQFPDLETLTLHLRINVTSPSVEKAISGDWVVDARKIGFTPSFHIACTYMLRYVKYWGPGKKKFFKLAVECRVADADGQDILDSNQQPWSRRSDEYEFGALKDPSVVLTQALESCGETGGK